MAAIETITRYRGSIDYRVMITLHTPY